MIVIHLDFLNKRKITMTIVEFYNHLYNHHILQSSLDMINIERSRFFFTSGSYRDFKVNFLILFLDPVLSNIVRPETSDRDFF